MYFQLAGFYGMQLMKTTRDYNDRILKILWQTITYEK